MYQPQHDTGKYNYVRLIIFFLQIFTNFKVFVSLSRSVFVSMLHSTELPTKPTLYPPYKIIYLTLNSRICLSMYSDIIVLWFKIFNLMRIAGNPGHRHGKPGSGYGIGCGIRFKTKLAQIKFDYAINAFHQRSLYFGISNLVLWHYN